jgi:lipid-binding SYLF domain-containing protein
MGSNNLRKNKMGNRTLLRTFVLVLWTAAFATAWADKYSDTVEVFEGAISGDFFEDSYGYAVFPSIGKAGIGIGGARGKGRVYVGGTHVGNTTMTQLSVGLQLGGQAFSQIIFFKDERAFEEFSTGNFEFGAQAQAVALTAGASAAATTTGKAAGASGGEHDASTVGEYHKGMAIFTVAKGGLMYEASVSGQKFSYDAVN